MLNQSLTPPSFVFPTAEAAAPVAAAAGRARASAQERLRAEDIRLLYQLASDFDSISPKLAAQLRGIAERH
ncbi:MAG TPA: hypothetical protein VJ652_04100 [Noviherbaspirillum sp.]|nr:hypothetical protein [Noviherbaspirillum sp.]